MRGIRQTGAISRHASANRRNRDLLIKIFIEALRSRGMAPSGPARPNGGTLKKIAPARHFAGATWS